MNFLINLYNNLRGITPGEKLEIMSHELEAKYGGHIKSGRFGSNFVEFDYVERFPSGIIENGANSQLKVTGKFKTIRFEKRT